MNDPAQPDAELTCNFLTVESIFETWEGLPLGIQCRCLLGNVVQLPTSVFNMGEWAEQVGGAG